MMATADFKQHSCRSQLRAPSCRPSPGVLPVPLPSAAQTARMRRMSCHGAASVTMMPASVAMAAMGTYIAVAVSGEWTLLHYCYSTGVGLKMLI